MSAHVKIGGVWKTATNVYTKVGGAWKTASDMPVKIAGAWKTGILGPSTGYHAIAHATLSADTSVTFSSIPQGYTDLKIVSTLVCSIANNSAIVRFNGVTTGYFKYFLRTASGSTITVDSSNAAVGAEAVAGSSFMSSATNRSISILDIPSYSSTTKHKTCIAYHGVQTYSGTSSAAIAAYNLPNTDAISSLTFVASGGNLTGTITLYGIKAKS